MIYFFMRVVGVVSFSHIVCVKVNDVNQLCLDRPVAEVLIVLLISFKCWYFFLSQQVRAPYKVQHPSKMSRIDTVFDCPQREGVVPPMSSVRIPVCSEIFFNNFIYILNALQRKITLQMRIISDIYQVYVHNFLSHCRLLTAQTQ